MSQDFQPQDSKTQSQRLLQTLTPEEARVIIRETVRESFLMLGVKLDDPIEVQKDFQHLREWRQTSESIKKKGMLAATGIIVSGLLAAVWIGIKEFIHR
ncbi:MAG: hypothetical protein WC982_05295 [Advenella sp.]